ncbi:MAG: poly(R)-hydroxyalkanoic acid synthase subunit PhaE [Desulforhopalus sp.]
MPDKKETPMDQGPGPHDQQKMLFEYLTPLFKPWTEMFQAAEFREQGQSKGRVAESLQTSLKMWQTMFGAISEPSELEHYTKATGMMPGIALVFTETCLQSMTSLQAQAGEWIKKRSASLTSADIQELDSELIKSLTETYENEFRRYLKIPQIGLSRLHQERMLQAIDKQNSLQLVLSEFLHMLYLPIEKSFKSLQEKMTEMTETGPVDEKSKTYYNLWIKLLEGHYMELFKQPEYADLMGKSLCALNEFVEARQSIINDLLKQVNIPTNQDLDELSKEIYLLKKRVRLLEKK